MKKIFVVVSICLITFLSTSFVGDTKNVVVNKAKKSIPKSIAKKSEVVKNNQENIKKYNEFSSKGDYDSAINYFTQEIKNNPKNYSAYFFRASSYFQIEDYKKSISDCDKAISLNINYSDPYCLKGRNYEALNLFDMAITNFNKAIALDPLYDEAYWGRGLVYQQQRRFQDSINDFNKCMTINPNFGAVIYYCRGISYGALKKYEESIEDLSRAIAINSNNEITYYYRGQVYEMSGDKVKAINDYKSSIYINPNYTLASNALKRLGAK